MDVLGDVVARGRDLEGTVLRTAGGPSDRTYDFHRFATTAMKAGNFLRLHGVRAGATVGIAARPVPEPVLGCFGAALLGAAIRFDPPRDPDVAALLLPTEAGRGGEYDPAPGTTVIAYGDDPGDPDTEYFERGIWSENPSFPPTTVDPDAAALRTADGSFTHGALLSTAERLAEDYDLGAGTRVVLRAPMAAPWAFVAGVVAPMVAGATVVLVAPGADDGPGGDLAVVDPGGDTTVPERAVVGPADVPLGSTG